MFSSNTSQVSNNAVFVEDVFSTWLYTGNGSTQTINNGIDLAGKGGLTWIKGRSVAQDNWLFDTVRGAGQGLRSNTTNANFNGQSVWNQAFSATGFSFNTSDGSVNQNGATYASWTFREQPKFFDVVTWTGDGNGTRNISHNLGSIPGFIIVKRTNFAENWLCVGRQNDGTYVRGSTTTFGLNTTNAAAGSYDFVGNGQFTSTTFALQQLSAAGSTVVNENGATYVAYLFAHNAGGFGLTGTDNVISCGSFTSNGGGLGTVNLGYEPQWVMVKYTDREAPWVMSDTMRGLTVDGNQVLFANNADAESSSTIVRINSTGFTVPWVANATAIYIAIRRGPMRTPTTGTSVFTPVAQNSAGTVTTNFPVDLMLGASRNIAHNTYALDRLRGSSTNSFAQLRTDTTSAESSGTGVGIGLDNNTGFVDNWFVPSGSGAASGSATVYWNFRRAPGFFDEVCYTGNGSDITINHNLGVPPELVITKCRNSASVGGGYWYVGTTLASPNLYLNRTDSANNIDGYSGWTRTATTYQLPNADFDINNSGNTYVAYLFASCPGVSKVGSYTGTGTTQVINCGFTAGSRFVMIKRTDSTGDWYVWDSARGIVAGNDPYLLLNSAVAEVTSTDFVDTAATGFELSSTAPAAINANGGTFIFLAIA